MWTCSIRSKKMRCPATVLQTGGEFQLGTVSHIHPADPKLPYRVKVSAEVSYNKSSFSVNLMEKCIDL